MVLKAGKASDVGMSQMQLDRIEEMTERWIKENFTPAVTYLIARRGIIVLSGAAGTQGPGKDSPPIKRDAIFPLASITKLFTATAIMILTEEGWISPVTRACEIIPEFKGEGCDDNKRDIFISHLLTHTSGLNDEDIGKYAESVESTIEIPPCEETQDEDLHKRLYCGYGSPLTYKIGSYMSYSSYGYELLGEIVRRVSGKSLDSFFREKIFEPLGMKDTYMVVPESVWDRTVKPREDSIMKWMGSPGHLKRVSAAGGVYSAAYDVAVFGQMFMNGGTYGGQRILSKLSVRAMTQNWTEDIPSGWGSIRFPQSGWGLGFMISLSKKEETGTLRSPQTYSHTGYGCTYLAVDPVNEVVMTCFQVTRESPDLGGDLSRRFDIFSDVALAAIED